MERNTCHALTIRLLRCALTGDAPDALPDDAALKAVYRCANRYDLAHCVGYALQRAHLLPESDVGDAFRKKQMEAIFRTERQLYESARIGEAFENAGIAHIFLKGAVLRRCYPEPWLRTGSDVDILVRWEEQEAAIALLQSELGYRPGLRTPHDAHLEFPTGGVAELHVRLSGTDSAESLLSGAWEMSEPVAGKRCERMLTPEIFYVYHIAHMAHHIEEGGCGIRPLMDLWIMEREMPRNQNLTQQMLSDAKLLTFAETAEALKDFWFSDGKSSELARRMGDYILCGGAFGSVEKKVAVGQIKTGGKTKNLIARMFLPYETMAEIYPALKTHRLRLPYYQLCRWYRLLFKGRAGNVWAELRCNQTASKENIRATEMLLKDLELL